MKPIIYLQHSFWKELSSSDSLESLRTMLDISDVLCDSHVITDASEEDVQNDVFLMVFIKKGNYQRCNELYVEQTINNLNAPDNTENLCATYLLSKDSSKCHSIEKDYGVVALNAKTVSNRRYLFKGDGFSMDKRKRYLQRYLTFKEKLYHPCNSLIIIDPYLLIKREKDKDDNIIYPGIANNLESLLDAILPYNLKIDFHLTIISSLGKTEEVKRVYEKIKKSIRRIRRDLNVKLGLFYTGTGYYHEIESFHSRHILSNTYAVDSEDGLDLFNENGYLTKNNPVVSIVFPRLFGNSRQDLEKYCRWLSSVKKYVETDVSERFYGSKENRLFELIKE